MQQDGISKLHAALQADGLVKGDENSFRQRITSSEDNCRQLYDALRSDGLVQGDYNSFKQHLGVTYSETPSGVSGGAGVSGSSGSSGGAGTEGIQSARNARSSRNAGGGREFPSAEVEFPVTAAEAAARAAEVGASGGNAGRTGVTGGSGKAGVSGNSGNTGNIGSAESAGSAGGAVDTGVQDGRAEVVNKRFNLRFTHSNDLRDWEREMNRFAKQSPKNRALQLLVEIAKKGRDASRFRRVMETLLENTTDANVINELAEIGFSNGGSIDETSARYQPAVEEFSQLPAGQDLHALVEARGGKESFEQKVQDRFNEAADYARVEQARQENTPLSSEDIDLLSSQIDDASEALQQRADAFTNRPTTQIGLGRRDEGETGRIGLQGQVRFGESSRGAVRTGTEFNAASGKFEDVYTNDTGQMYHGANARFLAERDQWAAENPYFDRLGEEEWGRLSIEQQRRLKELYEEREKLKEEMNKYSKDDWMATELYSPTGE